MYPILSLAMYYILLHVQTNKLCLPLQRKSLDWCATKSGKTWGSWQMSVNKTLPIKQCLQLHVSLSCRGLELRVTMKSQMYHCVSSRENTTPTLCQNRNSNIFTVSREGNLTSSKFVLKIMVILKNESHRNGMMLMWLLKVALDPFRGICGKLLLVWICCGYHNRHGSQVL
jgi:hypothetical protein